jgi:hypothetical protein
MRECTRKREKEQRDDNHIEMSRETWYNVTRKKAGWFKKRFSFDAAAATKEDTE